MSDKLLCLAAAVSMRMLLMLPNLVSAARSSAIQTGKVRIIYTNDTIGYLEPCGCGGRYQGGLARRATVIARLVKENPNTLLVDSGNLADKASKLPLVVKLMADMHYDAVGIGEVDSSFGDDYFKTTAAFGLKIVETGCAGNDSVVPYLVKSRGGVSVGVVSFGKAMNGKSKSQPDLRQPFRDAYLEARRQSDVLVLLDQGGIATKEWLEGEATHLGAPDIVIGGVVNSVMLKERIIGKTHIVPTSVKGKLIGVADISIISGQPFALAVQMVPVDKSVPEDEAVRKQIGDFLTTPRHSVITALNFQPPQAGEESRYYDPASCKTCHPS